ncbi:MAG TPA: hypothetical protein PKV91_06505 [Bacillota bacterium]|nr:hypothetical protein [Bacillota bacterium]
MFNLIPPHGLASSNLATAIAALRTWVGGCDRKSLADAGMVVDHFSVHVRGDRFFIGEFKPLHLFDYIFFFID